MKIAVIGGGVSGLVVADRLCRRHEVTLFEAHPRVGGHANTVDVDIDGEKHAIDTGFIVFNDRTYPHFVELLDELGVASRPTSMSFSVRCERTGLEYSGSTLNGLFAQRRNLVRPRFWGMVRDILRFNRESPRELASGSAALGTKEMTVGEFLRRGGYSREFSDFYLLPMGAAIWSCPVGVFENFPIRFIIEFYRNHGLLELRDRPTWRVVAGGSRTYVNAILKRFRGRLLCNAPIERVWRLPDRVEVKPRGAAVRPFDHVVFACHSDQALRLLADPTPTERELLGAFPYERSTALLHTDVSILPRYRRAWASWNYHIPRKVASGATVTYCMNILQHIRSKHVFNVSLNCEEWIDPAKVVGQFVYEHPIFTTGRAAAQARHGELLDRNRTSYCGAYWRNGFHEDGVMSALAVCRALESVSPAGQRRSTLPAASVGVA